MYPGGIHLILVTLDKKCIMEYHGLKWNNSLKKDLNQSAVWSESLLQATLSHCLPSEKRSTIKEQNLLPVGSNYFPLE